MNEIINQNKLIKAENLSSSFSNTLSSSSSLPTPNALSTYSLNQSKELNILKKKPTTILELTKVNNNLFIQNIQLKPETSVKLISNIVLSQQSETSN